MCFSDLRTLTVTALAGLLVVVTIAAGQDTQEIQLPEPTGVSAVGTTVWHWIDSKRADGLTLDPNDVREIMAQAWYPASRANSAGERAPYAPLYRNLSHVRASSFPAAGLAPGSEPLPILLIVPGRGVARHFYTAVAEDLASHGYFVLVIDSPHIGRVVYADGRSVPPADRYRIPFEILTGPYEKVDEFFQEATSVGEGDVVFALRQLAAINQNDPANRFTGHLNLSRLGVFGHSLGGRIAGAAVSTDSRFLAYASMEGVPPRGARKGGMDAAVLMLVSSALPDMAQPNIREIIPKRRNDVFVVTLEGFGHNSLTDLPLISPKEHVYGVDPAAGIEAGRVVLRNFFDKYVGGRLNAMDAVQKMKGVRVEGFAKP